MKSIEPQGLNHFNLVLPDFEGSLDHFRTLFDADFLLDLPGEGYHAGLFEIGRVIFEIFAPDHWLMNARYGAHYLGVEYRADMESVREAIAARGIRIVRDVGAALHTHPADTFGVAFEFYDGSFHDRPYALLDGNRIRPASFWRDGHPLGLTGLRRYSLAVGSGGEAVRFLEDFLSGQVTYRKNRPEINARAVGVTVGGTVVEVLEPDAEGVLSQHLHRYGDGIRSVVFGVRELDPVRRYFAAREVETTAGDGDRVLALPPAVNLGILMEFSE